MRKSIFNEFFRKLKGIFEIGSITKPQKFENFICRYFKDSGEFDLIKRPSLLIDGIKSEQDNLPDCKFRDKRSGKIFWLECKWRPKWEEKNGTKMLQFKRNIIEWYKNVQKKSGYKIFFALGIGIYRETRIDINSRELYFFPLDMFANRFYIRQSYLLQYNRMHLFKYKRPKFFPETRDLR